MMNIELPVLKVQATVATTLLNKAGYKINYSTVYETYIFLSFH